MQLVTHHNTNAPLAAVSLGLFAFCAALPAQAQQASPAPAVPVPSSSSPAAPAAATVSTTPPVGVTVPLQVGNGAAPTANADLTSSPAVVPDDYQLDTGDTIQVDVLRHADVSRTLRLLSDAQLRLPRLPKPIAARGKTCAELADEITARLQGDGKLRLVPNAVTVSVTGMRMRRIYVRGNAGRSGDFDLQNNWRISEAVAVIGGVPAPERVTARVLNPARPTPISINLANALTNPDSADNLYLREGDTLTLDLPRQKRFTVSGEGPRGQHEIDERLGLRQTMTQLGFSTNGATGDLRHARLLRHETPSDPTSAVTVTPIDLYTLMSKEDAPEVPLQDYDTLDIPVSQDFVTIWGETSAPHKYLLPQDRPTYLSDIMALGGTSGRAKIDDIQVLRATEWKDNNGMPKPRGFKFGKFLSKGDASQNPEIKPGDQVYVPAVNRPDIIGGIWQSWGLFGIIQAVVPGARLR